jgi:hypothetical protein
MIKNKKLYLEYWKCPDKIRDLEILDAIEKNIQSELFNTITIFHEKNSLPILKNTKNIIFIETDRLKLNEILEYINLMSSENDVNILACTDIIFDESINYCLSINADEFYAITRYESDGVLHNPNNPYGTSQDCWIFLGKFRGNLKNYNFYFFGIPGADGKIAFNTIDYYYVKNPCKSIKLYHNHKTNIRVGDSDQIKSHIKIPTPHLFIMKSFIEDKFEYNNYLLWDESIGHCVFDKIRKNFPCLQGKGAL